MSEKQQLGSIRERVAQALYSNTGAQITPWADISPERRAGWLSDADIVIPIVAEACARVPDQRDPEKPEDYCVIDHGDTGACIYARCRREKWTCHYWAPISGQPSNPVAVARVEGFRAGAEAMRESAADLATTLSGVVYSPMDEMFRSFGNAVRSLPIPEEQNNG